MAAKGRFDGIQSEYETSKKGWISIIYGHLGWGMGKSNGGGVELKSKRGRELGWEILDVRSWVGWGYGHI
jgi:hypothetical protein